MIILGRHKSLIFQEKNADTKLIGQGYQRYESELSSDGGESRVEKVFKCAGSLLVGYQECMLVLLATNTDWRF